MLGGRPNTNLAPAALSALAGSGIVGVVVTIQVAGLVLCARIAFWLIRQALKGCRAAVRSACR